MQIALVVPVYDESATLPQQLAHLQRLVESDADLELLLVDGGSSDGSREILEASGVRWIGAERGRARQMNAGARATRAELLLFLHADTRLPSGALPALRAAATSAPAGFFRVRLDSGRPLLRLTGWAISLRSRLTGIATGDQAIWIRRAVFDALGGFVEIPLFEDLELCRRVRAFGRPAALPLTVETSARRWEREGAWRTILRMWTLRAAYSAGVQPERLARYYGVAR